MCRIRLVGSCAVEIVEDLDEQEEIATTVRDDWAAGDVLDVMIYGLDEHSAAMQFRDGATFSLPRKAFEISSVCGFCDG